MLFESLAIRYDEIEQASGSIEKTNLFSQFLQEIDSSLIGKVIALTMSKLYPDWKGAPELGIAGGMAIQIIAKAGSLAESDVKKHLQKTGDLGLTAEELLQTGGQMTLFPQEITIESLYDTLLKVSETSGSGSNKEKVSLLVGLLNDAKPIEMRYILRIITSTMRLGLGQMGIMDALSISYAGDKSLRESIERAYNVCSDLVEVANILAIEGPVGLADVNVSVGVPIRMMAAKKLTSSSEILEKAKGRVFVEYKYDGERVQVHKDGDEITLFSRRQEVITHQYPDIVNYISKFVSPQKIVLEGEILAIDPETSTIRPFQDLMRRRRKTGIEEMQKEVPAIIRFFDILYLDEKDVTNLPMMERRELLTASISSSEFADVSIGFDVSDPEEIDRIFKEALDTGHEGIIAKAVHEDSTYQAGSRSWLWIKLKASYQDGLSDSLDLVIVGAIHGRGKRTGVYGTILASVYDPISDSFPTVCKIGTGFTDDVLTELKERLDPLKLESTDSRVRSEVKADVWFEPSIVIEVIGDEITISPTHQAGKGQVEGGGLALRFPRFTGRWRDDKDATQATTVAELIEMFETQLSRTDNK